MHGDIFPQIVQLVVVGILGIISYFVKRIIKQLDDVETTVKKLEIQVAVVLDRDRRRRLQDYSKDDEYLGG